MILLRYKGPISRALSFKVLSPFLLKARTKRIFSAFAFTTAFYGYQTLLQKKLRAKCDSEFKFGTAAQSTIIIHHYKSDEPVASGLIVDENGLCISIANVFPSVSEEKVDLDQFYARILGQENNYKLTLQGYLPDQNLILFKLNKQDPDIKFTPAKFNSNIDLGSDAFILGKSKQNFNVLEKGQVNEVNYNVRLGFGKDCDTNSFNIMANIKNSYTSVYGGPLLDKQSHVLGLVIPFDPNLLPNHVLATPSDYLHGIVDQYKKTGKVRRPYMGMSLKSSSSGNGAYVIKVNSDGPAHSAGVKLGETIMEINDQKISNANDFYKCVGFKLGEKLKMKLEKDGKIRVVYINPE